MYNFINVLDLILDRLQLSLVSFYLLIGLILMFGHICYFLMVFLYDVCLFLFGLTDALNVSLTESIENQFYVFRESVLKVLILTCLFKFGLNFK